MEKKVLIIIPAYNEEKNILNVYNSIKNYKKVKYDVIVINDGSKDNTYKVCIDNKIPVINLIHNLGIGGAVQTGYKYALENDYDIAVQFDGDGQHNIDCVKDIIKPIIDEKANLVIGSRFVEKNKIGYKATFARLIGIRIISFFIKLFSGKKVYDTTSGFRACDKDLIKFFSYSYPIEYPEPVSTVEIVRNGYKFKEVPVIMNERKEGKSSIASWRKAYYMINVILSMFVVWLRGKKK
ncbi:MAG: glycosyltransferase family 2 protein [Bacilli bacterium]